MAKRTLPLALVSIALLPHAGCRSDARPPAEMRAGDAPRAATTEVSATSLEQWMRTGLSFRWQSGEPMPEQARQVWGQLGRGGVGYGFRTFEVRTDSARAGVDSAAQALVANMEYWHVTLDELHTAVVGDIGLAWGVYTEEYKARSRSPETIRVRFTNTLRWDGRGWENLLYHRDAQSFGEDGSYRAGG